MLRSNIVPAADGKWKLFNIVQDIRETTDISKEHPDILNKMVSAYDKWAQKVGIIVPEYSEEQKKGYNAMPGKSNQTEQPWGLPIEQ
ncbi:MAG: hypothetical protein E6K94_06925 [Thaumarchaeota archaeon]|nr:MAG: hypothetical protein E6L03_05510 [Nitrososphaerota archaeon]TLX90504.1 MAG: hypothetical protein E6K94_06925 [Nitrososphaerota archaeon]